MRAIETGRYMLRATNTGVTAIIDSHGKVLARLAQFTEGALAGDAQGYTGASPYVRWGNVPIVVIGIALLAALAIHRRRAFRTPRESR
jgi:apolipoprotein N-acyltransferase